MIPWFILTLLLLGQTVPGLPAQTSVGPSSEAVLQEGNFTLTVTVLDDTRGSGVAGAEVLMKLRRGFIFLGRQKKDLLLVTNPKGRAQIKGLPKGKVDPFFDVREK